MKDKFIRYFMRVARETAQLSSAEKLKVGSIIVKDNRIISIGYNGTPSDWDNVCEYKIYYKQDEPNFKYPEEYMKQKYPFVDQDGRYFLKTKPEVLHAELNCIGHCCESGESTRGTSMFVTTAPCLQCSLLISTTGIRTVYYDSEYRSSDGVEFLTKLGIDVINYKD